MAGSVRALAIAVAPEVQVDELIAVGGGQRDAPAAAAAPEHAARARPARPRRACPEPRRSSSRAAAGCRSASRSRHASASTGPATGNTMLDVSALASGRHQRERQCRERGRPCGAGPCSGHSTRSARSRRLRGGQMTLAASATWPTALDVADPDRTSFEVTSAPPARLRIGLRGGRTRGGRIAGHVRGRLVAACRESSRRGGQVTLAACATWPLGAADRYPHDRRAGGGRPHGATRSQLR